MDDLFKLDIEITESTSSNQSIQPRSATSAYQVTTAPGITCQGGRNSSGCPSNVCTGVGGPCRTSARR